MNRNTKPEGGAQAPLDRSLVLGAVNDASDDLARLADGIAALETVAHAANGQGLALSVADVAGAAYWIARHLDADLHKARKQVSGAAAMLRRRP